MARILLSLMGFFMPHGVCPNRRLGYCSILNPLCSLGLLVIGDDRELHGHGLPVLTFAFLNPRVRGCIVVKVSYAAI